ncbi:MAG: hypothetical protein WCK18_09330 [Prolixibacteraceae bacterium]
MPTSHPTLPDYVQEIIFKNNNLNRHHEFSYDPFWENLKNAGTEFWLDTGDIGEAEKIWIRVRTALTIDLEPPENGKALETMAHQLGCGDMFLHLPYL